MNSGIKYGEMFQDALQGVVRKVLEEVAVNGLPGAHHLYIAFRTDDPGVNLPRYLTERYAGEMTIVLQHQFWDLKVDDDHFSVCLSFGGKPETLTIPFDAISSFLDPSVPFGLQLKANAGDAEDGEKAAGDDAAGQDTARRGKDSPAPTADAGKVVSLDVFRKK